VERKTLNLKQQVKGIGAVARLNEAIKAFLQEYRSSLTLANYKKQADVLELKQLGEAELREALRKRLAWRPHPRWPKVPGEIHIFMPFCVYNWEQVLPKALSAFGVVTAYDWRARGYDESSPRWLEERDGMNRDMLEAFRTASSRCPVDAVVGYLSGHNTDPAILRAMASEGAAIFNFCWDDVLAFPGRMFGGRYTSPAALAADVDLNLSNVPESVIKYRVHGGLAAFLPEGADPETNKPYDVPFEYDVSFVGARYGWRPRFMQALEKLGFHVECFGQDWPKGLLPFDEMAKIYSRSRINLGFSGIGHSKRLCCLKGRDFEVPMSGGLYLTQDHLDLHNVYEVGKEIVTYTTAKDCAEKIRWLLDRPDQAQAIRQAGRERCLRDYSYKVLWSRLFRMAGILE
jgi:spore maturation protein CgeB